MQVIVDHNYLKFSFDKFFKFYLTDI
jgi:hypothetical protein